MYAVVRYRSPKAEEFKEVTQLVFDQHSMPDDGGLVTVAMENCFVCIITNFPRSLFEVL
jgi:hypothetical protein